MLKGAIRAFCSFLAKDVFAILIPIILTLSIGCFFYGNLMDKWLGDMAFNCMAYMGSFWQIFIIINFIISVFIACLPIGKIKIG